jgi:hypothetical protein
MMIVHPAMDAAMMALMPTAPVPKTAMLVPGAGRKMFSTPPAPL